MSGKDNGQAYLGPILHQDSISFHFSHQPPLKVFSFSVVNVSLLLNKSDTKLSEVVDGSNESLHYPDEELDPNLRIGSPLQKKFEKVYVRWTDKAIHLEELHKNSEK